MTYDELNNKLVQLNLIALKDQFEMLLKEEGDYLLESAGVKKTQAAIGRFQVDAQTFYALDVTTFLDANGGNLTPEMALDRRRPKAWAIAQKILAASVFPGPCCQSCGGALQEAVGRHIHDYALSATLQARLFQCQNRHLVYLADQPA